MAAHSFWMWAAEVCLSLLVFAVKINYLYCHHHYWVIKILFGNMRFCILLIRFSSFRVQNETNRCAISILSFVCSMLYEATENHEASNEGNKWKIITNEMQRWNEWDACIFVIPFFFCSILCVFFFISLVGYLCFLYKFHCHSATRQARRGNHNFVNRHFFS